VPGILARLDVERQGRVFTRGAIGGDDMTPTPRQLQDEGVDFVETASAALAAAFAAFQAVTDLQNRGDLIEQARDMVRRMEAGPWEAPDF
jgi:hypothetical protein